MNNKHVKTETAISAILRGHRVSGLHLEDEIETQKYIENDDIIKRPCLLFENANQASDHSALVNTWYVPKEYLELDVGDFLLSKCQTRIERERVEFELDLYEKHRLTHLLRVLVYIVDTMREAEVLWGVGRGSSVSSYCLYLMGLHKVDSIKYNLDIEEFLK